jgi:hypothetical protein
MPEQLRPLDRLRAHVLGLAEAPQWSVSRRLEIEHDGGVLGAGFYLEKEDTGHPEQTPLLALRQIDDSGLVCGQVWLGEADLPLLADGLMKEFMVGFTRRLADQPDDLPMEPRPLPSLDCD